MRDWLVWLLLTPLVTSHPLFQYLQLKKKLEDEFPGRLDIVSFGDGEGLKCGSWPSLGSGWQWGWFGSAPPFTRVLHSLGGGGCAQEGPSAPSTPFPAFPQCGEGTPQVTGFFEVLVAGKLVHSKKVCLSVLPHFELVGAWGWDLCLGTSSLLPFSPLPPFLPPLLPTSREVMATWIRRASF